MSNARERQIVFWHTAGPCAGRQNTLSLAKYSIDQKAFLQWRRHVQLILQAQRLEEPLPAGTIKWMATLPRKQLDYLRERLFIDAVQFERGNVDEWLDEFESARQQSSKSSESTDAAVMRDCRLLAGYGDVRSIDESLLSDLAGELSERYADSTLSRIIKHWSTFFGWLRSQHAIEFNPCDGLGQSIDARPKDIVREEWFDRIVDACETTEERYWIRLLQWTGCRLREGLSLRAGDFDFERRRITITETKNDRVRINPLYPAIVDYAAELVCGLGPGDRVLRRITSSTCYRWLQDIRGRAGVPQWKPAHNAIRATRATQLASDPTVTPQQAGMLLGHSVAVARRNYVSVEERLLERLSA